MAVHLRRHGIHEAWDILARIDESGAFLDSHTQTPMAHALFFL